MNNSINKKVNERLNKIINLNLSSTSSDFLQSDYNNFINKNIQHGGFCACNEVFKAESKQNFELVLYILKQNNCCFKCQDFNGNTLLHLLAPYYSENIDIKILLDNVLEKDCSQFINTQNDYGQTPLLIAVMNDENDLANKMESAGADKSIVDINGNFVYTREDEEINEKSDFYSNINSDTNKLNRAINIINIIIEPKSKLPELSSLRLNDDTETVNISNSDNFMDVIKSRINDEFNKNKLSSSSESIKLPEIQTTSDSVNTDKFIIMLNNDKNSFGNTSTNPSYSDIENTDEFISLLKQKYSNNFNGIKQSDNINDVCDKINLSNISDNSDVSNPNNVISSVNNSISDTSSFANVNTSLNKLANETTSDNSSLNANTTVPNTTVPNTTVPNTTVPNTTVPNTTVPNTVGPNVSVVSDTSSIANANSSLANQTTSDNILNTQSNNSEIDTKNKSKNKFNIFKTNNEKTNNIKLSSEVDTNTLLNVIKKIQGEFNNQENIMVGGAINKVKKQQLVGYRKINEDSDLFMKKKSDNIDYNLLYNSDSEFGKKANNNELARMMISQKEKYHQEVLNMLIGMLNKGLLLQSNKPIESNERNAKLIKAYIYRQISEKNPQMSGMDKILLFQTMGENEIINYVKKMPSLDELEKNIQKHLDEKLKSKDKLNKEIDVSDTVESEKKSSKKSSKKSDKKSDKKSKK